MIYTFKLTISLGWLMINYQYTTCEYQEIFPPEAFLVLGVSGHFGLKNETRKTVKIPKDVELYLYELSLYAYFSVSKCPNISIYIYYSQIELKH